MALKEGLEKTKKITTHSNEAILSALKSKLSDFHFMVKAEIWEPKALVVEQYSIEILRYIDNIKTQLKKETTKQGFEPNARGTEEIVKEFFDKKGNGTAFYEKLKKYKKNVLQVDPLIFEEFHDNLLLIAAAYDTTERDARYFTEHFFEGASTMEALVLLSQIENNVEAIENELLSFCIEQVPNSWDGFFVYSPVISQSSSYVSGGESIELTAGIGSLSTVFNPKIMINGKIIQLSEDGAAHYIFHSSRKPGKHIIPLKIEYTDEFQKKQILEKNIEYTVAKE
jgi:hypothetical protein